MHRSLVFDLLLQLYLSYEETYYKLGFINKISIYVFYFHY